MADDRIMMQNPNTGRDDRHIRVAIYEPVRDAILTAIHDAGSVRFMDLCDHLEARTPAAMWKNASPGWYTTSVKLHLEAIGLLSRSGSPQELTLTDEGLKVHKTLKKK